MKLNGHQIKVQTNGKKVILGVPERFLFWRLLIKAFTLVEKVFVARKVEGQNPDWGGLRLSVMQSKEKTERNSIIGILLGIGFIILGLANLSIAEREFIGFIMFILGGFQVLFNVYRLYKGRAAPQHAVRDDP